MNDPTRSSQPSRGFSAASSSASSLSQDAPQPSDPNKALPPPPSRPSPPPYPPSHSMRRRTEHSRERRHPNVHSHSTPSLVDSSQPSHNHHGAIASHFLAQPNAAYGGQTWVDFLRETGVGAGQRQPMGRYEYSSTTHNQNPHDSHIHNNNPYGHYPAQPSSSSRFTLPAHPARTSSTTALPSTERKRRLTTAESPVRRPSGRRTSSTNASGSSAGNPINLDGSSHSLLPPSAPPSFPAFPPPRSSSYHNSVRRRESNMSDIALPPWQPDAEVTQCPVCKNHFSFFYRKHHCRKCGRVVCATCSPHRITIPRQYIVHPPSETAGANIIDLSGSDDDNNNNMAAFGPFRNPALGGGEVVRVCNPCVPDPNFSPPPQPPPYTPRRPEPANPTHNSLPRGHRSSQSANDISQPVNYPHRHSHAARDAFTRDGITFRNSTRVADLWPPGIEGPSTTSTSMSGHHSSNHTHHPSFNPPEPAGRGVPSSHQPDPRPPRREIPEEDECPVCGNELPPKGPNGEETAREDHINDCISSFSGPPTMTTSTSLPATRTRGMSDAAVSVGSPAGPSNRHSMFARGLFPYVATEKDCLDEDGEQAECVICFEEFEAGDQMARLVCLCRFHEDCIRKWWEKKGRGACPTHQLHEYE